MKKIIKGRRYDTETAKKIGSYSVGEGLDHIEETMYRKSTGEFFLYGCGGARTQYAQPIETGGWSSGERIMPMVYADAQKWAEEHLTADEYETVFGAVEDDGTKTTLLLSLTAAQAEQIKRNVQKDGADSISAWILSKIGV